MFLDRPAREIALTALDFETTGHVSDFPNEPWQIGLVELQGGRIASETAFDSWMRVGPRPFNRFAPGRHAQVRRELAVAPAPAELWPALLARLGGRVVVAHNAATERTQLQQIAPMHRIGPWVDTLRLARLVYPELPSHALDDLLEVLRLSERVRTLCPGREPHDALYDAIGCGVLMEHFLALPGWEAVTAQDLIECRS